MPFMELQVTQGTGFQVEVDASSCHYDEGSLLYVPRWEFEPSRETWGEIEMLERVRRPRTAFKRAQHSPRVDLVTIPKLVEDIALHLHGVPGRDGQILHIYRVRGWFGRYSAPGYLDRTEWSFDTSRRKLEAALRGDYGEG